MGSYVYGTGWRREKSETGGEKTDRETETEIMAMNGGGGGLKKYEKAGFWTTP